VIRGYRNLIHPGRVIRLNEKLNSKSGAIAKILVDIVVEEVSEAQKNTYGFTAEQIANKISKDSSAMTVLSHFLKETNEHERERLLTSVIPERYFSLFPDCEEPEGPPELDNLVTCFRQAFDTLPDNRKATVAKQFVKILREEGEERVLCYETAFLRASDLQYLSSGDANLAKQHLLSRLEREQTAPVIGALNGIGGFLNAAEIKKVTGLLLRAVVNEKGDKEQDAARDALFNLGWEVSEELGVKMRELVDEYAASLKQRGLEEEAAAIENIRGILDIPF
jgi:hypothetical protein